MFVIIGGGPSLTPEQVEMCRGHRVIAVNNAVYLCPWAEALYFCDARWFGWHKDAVLSFSGPVYTLDNRHLTSQIPGLISLRNDGTAGLCDEPDGLRTGRNSGYQAINLAVHRGATRILLLGFDMRAVGGKVHWHKQHPIATPADHLDVMRPLFRTLVEPLKARGVEVLNCTPGSALDVFPKVDLAEALA